MGTTAIANKSQPDCVFVGPAAILSDWSIRSGRQWWQLCEARSAEVDAVKLCSHSSPKGAFLIPCKMQPSKVCDR